MTLKWIIGVSFDSNLDFNLSTVRDERENERTNARARARVWKRESHGAWGHTVDAELVSEDDRAATRTKWREEARDSWRIEASFCKVKRAEDDRPSTS